MGKKNTLHSVHVQRNDTAENWTRVNPILQKGEMGVETDTRKFKFGDGVKHWQELDYADKTLDDAIKAEASRATQRENAIEAEVNAKANDADVVKNTMTVKATKLEAGQEPTIEYDKTGNTLTVGIPKGDTGATGPAGPAAGFGTPTATVDSGIGTPGVTVTATGPDTAKEFNFAFKNLKGDKGDPGVNATTTEVATTAKNGLMSATDKQKLENLKEFSGYVTAGKKDGTDLGEKATAEGNSTTASGGCSHAEGSGTTADGEYSHAEGCETTASGDYSHAEGQGTEAIGDWSHAEGCETTADGDYSHAEGCGTIASGVYSHAEGQGTEAIGDWSHAEGEYATASGDSSHAEGSGTKASGVSQHAGGKYNVEKTGTTGAGSESAFIIGNGTSSSRSNAFRVQFNGQVYGAGSYNGSGADYAEYFEWADGNKDKEDRRGLFVTLDEDRIRVATDKDDYILGIVSPNPSVVGNSPDEWHGRFLKDEWGNRITETITVTEKKPTPGKPQEEWETVEKQVESYVMNPEFSEEHGEYIPRSERAEWAAVGMLGVLVTRDDGTCRPNGYCKVDSNGRATASDIGYRVLKRVNGNLVKVLFR